jgi:peptide/nickel transport system ATP-binding protein
MTGLLKVQNLHVEGRPPGGDYMPIVKDINFEVNAGEVVALIGESGSGKSTISLAAMAFARPGCRISKGSILLDGQDILTLSYDKKRDLRGKRVTYVAQSAAASFNPAMTINRQVCEVARVHGIMDSAAALKKAQDLYRRLDLPDPENIGRRYPHQVSGGQLQRLMAAMALLSDPELVVFDEPTTALDVTTQVEVLHSFKEIIKTQQTAAIYVAHDLAVVTQMADRIIVLLNGDVVEQGTTEQIIHNPTHDYTRALMAAVRKRPLDELKSQQDTASDAQPNVLEVEGVTAAYGSGEGIPVLQDISLTLAPGETLGVIGESGCGKSTLARVIAGLLPPKQGRILLNSEALPDALKNRTRETLKRCQLVYQMADVALNPRQTVGEILGRPVTFYLGLKGVARDQRVHELLDLVELPAGFSSRFPGELSGGQKQRVNLARALAAEPDVILCDEVTSALDTIVAKSIIDLLGSLQKKLGVSYIFISHDISTVAAFADRVAVLYAGRVVELGKTADVLSPPFHPYTDLLLSSVPETRQGWLEDVVDGAVAKGISAGVMHTRNGCPFVNRCTLVIEDKCATIRPTLDPIVQGHQIFCHHRADVLCEQEIGQGGNAAMQNT